MVDQAMKALVDHKTTVPGNFLYTQGPVVSPAPTW